MANIPLYVKTTNEQEEVLFQDQLNQALQGALSDNGWTLPQQSAANITTIAPSMPDGTMWYDTDDDAFKVLVGGAVKTVTVT